jgi:hypothetical protein
MVSSLVAGAGRSLLRGLLRSLVKGAAKDLAHGASDGSMMRKKNPKNSQNNEGSSEKASLWSHLAVLW